MSEEIPKFWWFEGAVIHFDAPLYAKLRGVALDEAIAELTTMLREMLPDVPIIEE